MLLESATKSMPSINILYLREQVEPREEGSRDEDVVPHWVPWGEKRLGEETGGFLKSGR